LLSDQPKANRLLIAVKFEYDKLRILGFAGSLRVGSYNRALLHAATDLLPDGTTLEIFDLNGIPPFNQDLEMIMPAKVKSSNQK
jgi:chromate reductase